MPLLPAVVGRCFYDESPRHLLVLGKAAAAAEVVRSIARTNGTLHRLPSDFVLVKPLVTLVAERGSVKELCGPTMRGLMLPLGAVWFLLNFGFYGQAVNLPSCYAARGLELEEGYAGLYIRRGEGAWGAARGGDCR